MPEQPPGTQIDSTQMGEVPTAQAPPFRAPVAPIDVGSLQLRGLPTVGQRVDDFELIKVLGSGAFARVFLARQTSLNRFVALKVSHNLGQEARTLASLEHDHIVRVFSEVIDAAHDLRLLCMQYVPGTTLERVIAALAQLPPQKRDGRAILAAVDEQASDPAALDLAALRDRELLGELDPLEAGCWMGARLAEALAHAHGLGVLHRDVKPANVLVNRYGRPLLADFNVAVRRDGPEGQTFGGTLPYMAPEHLDAFHDGRNDDSVDERSDVYSLGVVLYELFTGRLPFPLVDEGQPSSMQEIATQRRAGAPMLAKYNPAPAALERVIARCLAPDPAHRFQNATELAVALESCRELMRVRRDLPDGLWLTRAALARPFLMAALLIALPHVLGSIVNITYNSLRIKLTPAQADAFLFVLVAYNAVVYPLCLGLFFRQWLLVYRVWQRLARPEPSDPAAVDEARRRALGLPRWAALLSAVGWLPGGVLFPLLIDLIAGGVDGLTYFRFLFSFTVSGLVALTYSVIAVEFVAVRVLYPGLWLDARKMKQIAPAELAREEGRMRLLQIFAVLIPLAGASLLLGVGPEKFDMTGVGYLGFRLLVTALIAAGMVGLGMAIFGASELRKTVDALTGGRRRKGGS
jgi:serine/threonine protein kinase